MQKWQEHIQRRLVGAGIKGLTQKEISVATIWMRKKANVSTEQMTNYLIELAQEDLVQRFTVKNKTIWRATTKMLERKEKDVS